ncbi:MULTISPECIES: hypothetical protein [Gracilibacillus]|uniref:hypothetical protein n=1 Tax=Gracilibacillus TaxID=74385 RepID=UPI000B33E6BC|nr:MULTISPECIES: hypothetical protein [Gracilibacillus]
MRYKNRHHPITAATNHYKQQLHPSKELSFREHPHNGLALLAMEIPSTQKTTNRQKQA